MRHFSPLLISLCFVNFLYAQCDITSLTYTMPDCNLQGQTVTVNWTATCPDELMRITLDDVTNNVQVQNYLNVPNTGTFDCFVSNYSLIEGNFKFYIEYSPSQEDWMHGPPSYLVNDSQISVMEELYSLTGGDDWTDNTGWLTDCDPCGITSGTPWYGLTCNGSDEIIKINLSNNGLVGEYGNDINASLSNHLCDLSTVQHIDLSNNTLTGAIPNCYFSTAKDTVKLNDNMLSGEIPSEIKFADSDIMLDISNNDLTGCFDNQLNPRCSFVNLSNGTISDGNSFEANWDDFCATGKGVCCESELSIDLATVENGVYYAKDQIIVLGISTATTDITLAAPLVKVVDDLAENVLGSNIQISGGGCYDKGGINLNTSSDYLYNSDFEFSGDFTMTFWFKTTESHGGIEGRMFNGNNASSRFEIGINSGKFWAYDGSSYNSAISYNDGVWHQTIIRNEGPNVDFYVDGDLVFSSNNGNGSLTGGFNIGRYSFSNIGHYIGSIADFRIYNDALDLTSVLQEYECGTYENDDQLDLHYSFSEGIPYGDNTALTMVIDDSGNGNEADIVAMTLTGTESNYIEGDDIQPSACCNQGFVVTCYNVIYALDPITGEAIVDATFFDDGTILNCSDGYTVSFTPDGLTTSMTFDCADVGITNITMYFISEDGLIVDSCDTLIEIQDNDNVCA